MRVAILTLFFSLAPAAHAQDLERLVAAGDAAFERRAEGQVDGRAAAEPIGEAVRSFERATRMEPERLDLQWRLLRALYYEADFASAGTDQERQRYRRGAARGDDVIALLNARVGAETTELGAGALRERLQTKGLSHADAARVFFWSAVHWGGWAREAGLLQAVRAGVANTMHRYTEVAVALDAGLERGGPLRLLSRMHATLPRVPFISGWVDRERAVPLASRAVEVLPNDVGNRYLLAHSLQELVPERHDEARRTMREIARSSPRPELLIEDLLVILEAREQVETVEAAAAGASGAGTGTLRGARSGFD